MDQKVLFLFVSPLIINIGLGIFLIYTITRQRMIHGARSLFALIIGASLWSFGYSMELISPDIEAKLFWAKFEYFGITTVPLAWLVLAFQLVGSPGWFLRKRLALGIPPLLTLILVWTNEYHGLIWRNAALRRIGSFEILALDHGPGFWFYLAFAYCLILFGSIELFNGLIASFPINRWRNSLRLLAILIPWIGNLVYVTHLNPVPYLDWSPLSFAVAGLLFAISLYRFPLHDILPIARKTVFEVLPDCLLVLDTQDRLIAMNTAAQKTAGYLEKNMPRGTPLAEVLPEVAQWASLAKLDEALQAEVTRGSAPDLCFYDLRIVPLSSSSKQPVGRLIVCHDITQYKRAQAQLEQIRAQLEQTVAERTSELRQAVRQLQIELAQRVQAEEKQNRLLSEVKRSSKQLRALAVRLAEAQEYDQHQIAVELHDRVGQNLTALNLNLQLIQNLIAEDVSSPVHQRLEDSMLLVEETVRQVRGLMADLNPPLLEEYGLGPALRFSCQRFMERTGIETIVTGEDFQPRLSKREEMALFRIVQEGLNNVVKHAQANRVEIGLETGDYFIALYISDNGQGFIPKTRLDTGSLPRLGLLSIQERAASIGGELKIDSGPGLGTCLKVILRKGEPDDKSVSC